MKDNNNWKALLYVSYVVGCVLFGTGMVLAGGCIGAAFTRRLRET